MQSDENRKLSTAKQHITHQLVQWTKDQAATGRSYSVMTNVKSDMYCRKE